MNLNSNMLNIDPEKVSQKLQSFIKTGIQSLQKDGVVIGISGGIDSSVSLSLCVKALSPDKILGLVLPERDSSPGSEIDARAHADELGVKVDKVDITPILEATGIYEHLPKSVFAHKKIASVAIKAGYKLYSALTGERPFLSQLQGTRFGPLMRANAYYRMKHRVRMVVLYSSAEHRNYVVIGNVNRTEYMSGFFVKWGDSCADITPLLPLYKTQVRQLARFLKIPQKIIDKAPTPDMIPGITDEFAMGITYDRLDVILLGLEMKMEAKDIAEATGEKQKTVEQVIEMVRRSEHMRNPPIGPVGLLEPQGGQQ